MIRFRRNSIFWIKIILITSAALSGLYCILVWRLRSAILHKSDLLNEDLHIHKELQDSLKSGDLSTPTPVKLSDVKVVLEDGFTDYHNYTLMAIEASQTGPGEQGKPYHLPEKFLQERVQLFKSNGFNARASDDISLWRSLPDIRHKKCKTFTYLSVLPTVSIVVPFHNEHFSTLLRTVISAISRSPGHLLKEIILVDDGSTKEFLKSTLDEYVAVHFSNVKVLKIAKRAGLIQARLYGAKEAHGDVIVFLDSHTECSHNWLPPLLEPIQKDYRTVMCPFIDVIDYDTFEYRAQDEGARGAFDWELYYKRLPLTQQDKENMPHPFKSPVMAGGLFAISSKFFWELGGYDPGLQIWGGEQYELSFKIWQCGGMMFDAPCSRVGHVYRKYAPFPSPGIGDYLGRNYKRVAEVWMDEYAEFLYKRRPHYRQLEAGDLATQKQLRKELNCKPFKWFMREIAFDLVSVYPPVEPPDYANGKISSVAYPHLCVDSSYRRNEDKVIISNCGQSAEQDFHFTWHKDIRPGKRNMCLDVSSGSDRAPITLYACHGMGGNQLWRYIPRTQQLQHGGNNRCLQVDGEGMDLFVSFCNDKSESQRWNLEHVNQERVEAWSQEQVLDPIR